MHGVTLGNDFPLHSLLPPTGLQSLCRYLVLLHRDDREQCTAPDGPVPLDVVSDRSEDEHTHRLRRLQVLNITERPNAVSSAIRLLPRPPSFPPAGPYVLPALTLE